MPAVTPQPFSCALAKTGDRRGDKGENQHRNEEVEEVTKEPVERGKCSTKPLRGKEAKDDAKHDGENDAEKERVRYFLEVHAITIRLGVPSPRTHLGAGQRKERQRGAGAKSSEYLSVDPK